MSTSVFVTLGHIECCDCGVVFGVTDDFEKRRRRDHKTFYCPWGHANYYPQESDVQRVERERDEARRRAAAAEGQAERERQKAKRERQRASGYKGQITKIKDRIQHGVCPCCNRTFQNLARHMEGQHPEWEPDEEVIDGLRVTHRGGPWYDVVREPGSEVIAGPIRGRSCAFRQLLTLTKEPTP